MNRRFFFVGLILFCMFGELSFAGIQCHEEVNSSTTTKGKFTFLQWKEIQRNWCERYGTLDEYLPYDECKSKFLSDMLAMLRESGYDLEVVMENLRQEADIEFPQSISNVTQKQLFIRNWVDTLFSLSSTITVGLDSTESTSSQTLGFAPVHSLSEVYGVASRTIGENTPKNLLMYGGSKFFQSVSIFDDFLPRDEIQKDFDFYASYISDDPEQVLFPDIGMGGHAMAALPAEVQLSQPDLKEPHLRTVIHNGDYPVMTLVEYVFDRDGRRKIKNTSSHPLGKAEIEIKRVYLGGRVKINSKYSIDCH